jgi:hypothetical protein
VEDLHSASPALAGRPDLEESRRRQPWGNDRRPAAQGLRRCRNRGEKLWKTGRWRGWLPAIPGFCRCPRKPHPSGSNCQRGRPQPSLKRGARAGDTRGLARRDPKSQGDSQSFPQQTLRIMPSPSGGIGRRAGFRSQWLRLWGFESPDGHSVELHASIRLQHSCGAGAPVAQVRLWPAARRFHAEAAAVAAALQGRGPARSHPGAGLLPRATGLRSASTRAIAMGIGLTIPPLQGQGIATAVRSNR